MTSDKRFDFSVTECQSRDEPESASAVEIRP